MGVVCVVLYVKLRVLFAAITFLVGAVFIGGVHDFDTFAEILAPEHEPLARRATVERDISLSVTGVVANSGPVAGSAELEAEGAPREVAEEKSKGEFKF